MGWRGGALHYILQRTVVLDKVEVRSSNRVERNAEIANHGDRFQKNLGQENGRAPIEINTAGMHLLHKRAEQAKIVVRGIAQRCAVGGGMHVRDVGADGQVNRHGDAALVRGDEDAGIGVFYFDNIAGEKLPGGFAITDSDAVRKLSDFIEMFSGFFGHAELAFAKAGLDVFGSVARERDFEIVDERRAVHGDSGNESAFHHINQNGTEADFDDVPADPPENSFALFARFVDGGKKVTKIFRREDVWK